MKSMHNKWVISSFASLFLSFHTFSQTVIIDVGVFDDQIELINAVDSTGECPDVNKVSAGENQMVFEYLLVCNIIKAGIPDAQFRIIGFPVVKRLVDALARGSIDVSGFGVWAGESSNPNVIWSVPLLEKNQFIKGLYATKDTLDKYLTYGDKIIKDMIAVSNKNWTFDWKQLECSDFNVTHVDRYSQMFNILERGRADVLPLAFGISDDLTRTEFGITLYALPNMKLVIPDPSHYLVSRRSPYANTITNIINEKLSTMRESGELEDWLIKVGVTRKEPENWATICNQ